MASRSVANWIIWTKGPWRPPSAAARPCKYALIVQDDHLRLGQFSKMPALLQPGEQNQARHRDKSADEEEPYPSGRSGDKSGARREIGPADGGQRREQRVLRRGVQRALTQTRQIRDKDRSTDRAGEILGNDRGRQRPIISSG